MKKRTTARTTREPARNTAERSTGCQDVPPEMSFWVRDGQILKNLRELPPALRKMSNETFSHHVNSDRNDFATWIAEVIGEPRLADTVRRLRTRAEIVRAIQARL